jgi:acetyltransferase-like isoleucine patch superfamily enzyme
MRTTLIRPLGVLARAFVVVLPWPLKRRALRALYGYRIDPTARIGLSWVYPDELSMAARSSIGHLTVVKGLARLELGEAATIGRGNWITGYPRHERRSFAHVTDRRPELVVDRHAAITNRHLIDCTDRVTIGAFATFAGFRSQILTHSIDLAVPRQSCAPVEIGRYCFVGTGSVLLGGSRLPDHSVLGAASLLNNAYEDTHTLYAGVPARPLRRLDQEMGYFTRTVGHVD